MPHSKRLPSAEFIANRPYRGAIHDYQAKVYDALIDRFKRLPNGLENEDPDELTEVGSFLIRQGVIVEILRNRYKSVPSDYVFVVDIAFEDDRPNMARVSNGSKMQHFLYLHAESFEDAVKGISDIMLALDC